MYRGPCHGIMGGGAFEKLCMLTSPGADPECTAIGTRVGVGKGFPGAEGADVRCGRRRGRRSQKRRAETRQRRRCWEWIAGFPHSPSPTD